VQQRFRFLSLTNLQFFGRKTLSNPRVWSRAWHAFRAVLPIFFLSRVVFYAAMLVAPLLIPLQEDNAVKMLVVGPEWLVRHWRWDAVHYYELATLGYPSPDVIAASPRFGPRIRPAFFPLLPVLIRIVATCFNGLSFPAALPIARAQPGVLLSGIVVGHAVALLAFSLVYQLAWRETNDAATARRAVLYTAFFPLGFYYAVPYTEALFLATSVAVFLAIRRQQWVCAGVWAAAASATRVAGVALAPVLVLAIVLAWRAGKLESWKRALAAIVLSPMGLVVFALHLWQRTGDPLAFVHAQADWLRQSMIPFTPLVKSVYYLLRPDLNVAANTYVLNLINLLIVGSFLAIFVVSFRRWDPTYIVYGAVFFTLILSSGLPREFVLQSVGRYATVFFPVYIVLAQWGRNATLHRRMLLLSIPLFVAFTILYVQWSYFV
jgi:Gpi18-like mannosyltransferase